MASAVGYVLTSSYDTFSTIKDYCDYHRIDYHTDTTLNGDFKVHVFRMKDYKRLARFLYRTKLDGILVNIVQ